MAKFKKSAIAKCVLSILAAGGIMTVAAVAPNSLQMLEIFGVNKKRYKPQSVYKALKRMEKKNIIEIIKETGGKTTISITRNGKKKLIEYSMDDMEIKKLSRWDGKWRIISFDIPEKQKIAREALRIK
ncbi:MAG: PaaX family transcriptional regulator, phenylacetic acid degradation operon negative regulatory [Parcubacteria group bacterium]|nr:PaaX family transcriptional regulator, phenylacetic acid degradation operon negative regulatory [Parcubacteria group bacterium]